MSRLCRGNAGYSVAIGALFASALLALGGCQSNSNESLEPVSERVSLTTSGSVEQRLEFVQSLFTGAAQHENFNRLAQLFPSYRLSASPQPHRFRRGDTMLLPKRYVYEGQERSVEAFLEETATAALLVIHKGAIRYENYYLTGGVDVQWMSMSVGKSFVSALVGIAVQDGSIASIEQPITDSVPELAGSAYDGVRIKDILQMSSGADWNEDYSDPDSDIMRYGAIWAGAGSGSFDQFTASLVRKHPPGTVNYYNSTDTQALGMLLARATGKSVSAYAQEKLWHPLGMEHDGFWITDRKGVEMAAGGLQVTARDYAKLGQLYLQGGRWRGEQLIDEDWIKASLIADAPHVQAEQHPEYPVGYGYQWWLPVGGEGEFSAIGVYNQFVFVNPTRDLVIVKLSANPSYGQTNDESSFRELETFELFRRIAAQFPGKAG